MQVVEEFKQASLGVSGIFNPSPLLVFQQGIDISEFDPTVRHRVQAKHGLITYKNPAFLGSSKKSILIGSQLS